MVLSIDETENEEYFIVAGLLLDSKENIEDAYKSFKKKAKKMPVAKRDRAKLFTEFKSTILDKHYQRIKEKMLDSLLKVDRRIVYSCHIKKAASFPQNFKEDSYIALLSRIILSIEENVSVIFDGFNKRDFEERIVERMLLYGNVQDILPGDSQLEPGLQYVDNICSIIRIHKMNADSYDFYSKIKDWTIEV